MEVTWRSSSMEPKLAEERVGFLVNAFIHCKKRPFLQRRSFIGVFKIGQWGSSAVLLVQFLPSPEGAGNGSTAAQQTWKHQHCLMVAVLPSLPLHFGHPC